MENIKNYIESCLEEILERANEANFTSKNDMTEFQKGYSLAYNEIITYLLNQTDVFQIKNELSNKIQNVITPL